MLLGSKTHTVGDTKQWTIDYDRWLDNAATIQTITAVSSSTTCTVSVPTILGHQVRFLVSGGTLNETCTVTLTMTDSFGNVKKDTLAFTVVAP
jgi:hypothetical protein